MIPKTLENRCHYCQGLAEKRRGQDNRKYYLKQKGEDYRLYDQSGNSLYLVIVTATVLTGNGALVCGCN